MEGRSFYLLAYDVTDDRRRAKLAKFLESLGARVQGSVFEAYLTDEELKKLKTRVQRVLEMKQDSLRIYFVCETCRGKEQTVGVGKVTEPPGVMIV